MEARPANEKLQKGRAQFGIQTAVDSIGGRSRGRRRRDLAQRPRVVLTDAVTLRQRQQCAQRGVGELEAEERHVGGRRLIVAVTAHGTFRFGRLLDGPTSILELLE